MMIVIYIILIQWLVSFISIGIIYHNDVNDTVSEECGINEDSDSISMFLASFIPFMGFLAIFGLWMSFLIEYHTDKLKKIIEFNYMRFFFGRSKCDIPLKEKRNKKIDSII